MIFINTASDTTGFFKPFFPITLPYGIAYLMAQLRSENIKFSFVDQQVDNNVLKTVETLVQEHQVPYLFAISTLTESYSAAHNISEALKEKYPDCIILMGGLHPTSMPERVLNKTKSVDYVFAGEGESVIVDIYKKIKSGQDLKDVNGIVYRDASEIVKNPPPKLITDLSSLPPFPYDIFAKTKRYNFGHIISSRGCPYSCTFCCVKAVGKRNYRYKSAERTVKELELLVTDFKQTDIAFFDDNFLANKKRIIELCGEISKSEILKGVTYSFQARTRDMDAELLEIMYENGFKAVFFGIETVSDDILKQIGKDETHQEIEAAIKLAQKIGYKVMANFLFCLPNETREVRTKCVDFAIKNKLDVAKFNNVVPYPGTVMYDQAIVDEDLMVKGEFSNFNSQEVLVRPLFKKSNFPFLPKDSTSYGMQQEILLAYFRFYMRIRVIFKLLTQRNWGGAIFSYGTSFFDALKKMPALLLLMIDISLKFELMFFSVFIPKGIKVKEVIKTFTGFFK